MFSDELKPCILAIWLGLIGKLMKRREIRYRKVQKVTTLLTFGLSSLLLSLLFWQVVAFR